MPSLPQALLDDRGSRGVVSIKRIWSAASVMDSYSMAPGKLASAVAPSPAIIPWLVYCKILSSSPGATFPFSYLGMLNPNQQTINAPK
jgi:hypothetical protein